MSKFAALPAEDRRMVILNERISALEARISRIPTTDDMAKVFERLSRLEHMVNSLRRGPTP